MYIMWSCGVWSLKTIQKKRKGPKKPTIYVTILIGCHTKCFNVEYYTRRKNHPRIKFIMQVSLFFLFFLEMLPSGLTYSVVGLMAKREEIIAGICYSSGSTDYC